MKNIVNIAYYKHRDIKGNNLNTDISRKSKRA